MTLPPSVSDQQSIARRRMTSGKVTLPGLRAADGRLTGYHFYPTSHEEATIAVEAADQAFPVYSQATLDVRTRSLNTPVDELDLFGEDLSAITHQEMALPLARLQGERARISNQLRMFAGVLRQGDAFSVHIDAALPDRQPLSRPNLRQYLTALGPAAASGASSFPLAFSTAGSDTVSALATGCPVVMKIHLGHIVTAKLTAQTIVRVAAASSPPVGVFNMIFGTDIDADLIRHSATQTVGLTGSLRGDKVFRQLVQQCPQPILVLAEASATNPSITLLQAVAVRAETLANELASSFILGCEQFCIKPGLILVLRGKGMSRFAQTPKVTVDQALAQTMLNAPTLAHYEEGASVLETHPHIQCLAGSDESVTSRAQARLHQALASLLLAQDPLLQQEVFGPLAVLVEAADEAELQSILHVIPGQLVVTVHAESNGGLLVQRLLPVLAEKAGCVSLNGYPTGVEVYDTVVHGGPWPATIDVRGTSVGTQPIDRFSRPVCLQDVSAALFPPAAQDDNPLNLLCLING